MKLRQRNLIWLLAVVIVVLPSLLLSTPEGRSYPKEETVTSDKSGKIEGEDLFKYTPPKEYKSSLLGLFFKTILALGIITGILYFILRFFFRGRGLISGGGDLFRVIGTHALAPNKYLQLIEIGHSLVLIGVTENGISLLNEIDDKESIDLIKLQASRINPQESMDFVQYLKGFLKRFHKESLDESLEEERKVAFLKDQRARLKKMIDERS